ncbi:MAG: lipoprotein-releasing transporter ATP-binding protein LolD [Pseudomonadota bacterium]|jgi:lipoprotein-releasing system ATP-binding protein
MSKQAVIDATGPLLRAQGVRMVYGDGQGEVVALQGVDLTLSLGETMAVVGASGAGKSTLLHILGGLDFPTSGEVWFEGRTLVRMSDKERTTLRNERIGFVYQFHHLLPEFTAQENVAMPLVIRRMSWVSALEAAAQMLDKVGLSQRLSHTPAMLSGGERQRVAIARALVTQPHCLLADEPTGNLDRDTAARVFDVLIERVRESKCGLIVVTHDPLLAARCDRQLQL